MMMMREKQVVAEATCKHYALIAWSCKCQACLHSARLTTGVLLVKDIICLRQVGGCQVVLSWCGNTCFGYKL